MKFINKNLALIAIKRNSSLLVIYKLVNVIIQPQTSSFLKLKTYSLIKMSLVSQLLEARFSARISIGFFLGIVTRELAFVFFVDTVLEGVICSSLICSNLRQIFFQVHLRITKQSKNNTLVV